MFYSCVVAGTGILGIPHALSRSGWIGLLFLVLSSLMAQFCGCLLIRCLYHGQTRRLSGFPEIGLATFGKLGQIVGAVFSQFLLIFTPTLYIILAGDNISKLLSVVRLQLSRKACTWIVSAFIGIPFALVRTMRDVSFMSFFASMATVCLVLVMTIVAVSDFQENMIQETHHDWAIAENIPIAFSTFSFSYCGNVIFPHLEASMAEPSSWPKVLLVATFSVTMIYVLMGTLCYLSYGNQVQTPVYNSIPEGSPAQNVAMLVATMHVLLAVPMYLYVFTVNVEKYSMKSLRRFLIKQHPSSTRIGLRIAEICFCALIAMLIPYFSDVMSLIGTMAAESLTFVLPCMFWIRLSWKDGGQTWELIICAFIAIIGTFCTVFGTADAVKEFLHDIRQGYEKI
ncbi:transmembrane amino acid transporter protein-domain-containing protein [Phascolomyces articulosus]|uniref:Transmembrane amino acid transporter protein-domain-containing protein n=1 Tax=Phascolomyces articulosus TaxID=60185 RepID=A0AAD5K847_9FUNG|nr:transmembrane amino acid transporter protein-domain-containing protein [Phascolomyces articulosus]